MSLAAERHGSQPLKQTVTNATNPTRRCSTSWLSSTTQPSKPHSKPGQHLPATSTRIQRPPPMWPSGVWFAGSLRGLSSRASSPSAVNDAAFARQVFGWPRRRADRRSLPKEPIRQWVLSALPATLLLARHPQLMGGLEYRLSYTQLI
ncbi:hypothetical protein BANRA_05537 [Escherichia coli]|nr:hypothetical protein BANRA_05537 [Escherichia coli]